MTFQAFGQWRIAVSPEWRPELEVMKRFRSAGRLIRQIDYVESPAQNMTPTSNTPRVWVVLVPFGPKISPGVVLLVPT